MRRWLAVAFVFSVLAPLLAPDAVRADKMQIAHPQQVITSEQSNQQERNDRDASGTRLRDLMGTSCSAGCYDDITISPAASGLYVTTAPTIANTIGTLYCPGTESDPNPMPNDGPTPLATLSPDTTLITVTSHQGSTSSNIGPLTAPGTSGQSIYYLIEAQCQTSQDTDSSSQQFWGLNGASAYTSITVNTLRHDTIAFQAKAGTASSSPTVPSVDSGWVRIGTVLVPYSASNITSGMIAQYSAYLGIGGAVTAVNAGSCLSSSGGTTPTLSLQTPLPESCGGSGATSYTNGALLYNNAGIFASATVTSPLGLSAGALGCATCVTAVTGTGNIASTGGTTPQMSFTGLLPIANGGCNASSYPSGYLLGYNGSSCYAVTSATTPTFTTVIHGSSGSYSSLASEIGTGGGSCNWTEIWTSSSGSVATVVPSLYGLGCGATLEFSVDAAGDVGVKQLYDAGPTASSLVYLNSSQELATPTIGNGLNWTSPTLSVNNCGAAICLLGLNIVVGGVSGSVSTSATFLPIAVGIGVSGGSVTELMSSCGTADNGTTVATFYKNGSSIGTLTLGSSKVTTSTISAVTVAHDDQLSVAITTGGGPAQNCVFQVNGTQNVH